MIDWDKLKPEPSQQENFEELCCQLAAREKTPEGSRFARLGQPDGGVECFWGMPDGTETGWQAKFHKKGVQSTQKKQIDKSIRKARETHPRMTRYVVCLPVNQRQGRTKTFRDKWGAWAAAWKEETGMDVEFWGSAEIDERLNRQEHAGRRRYFFDKDYLDAAWFDRRLATSIERAWPRYTPEAHVDLPVSFAFECLCRTPLFHKALQATANRIRTHCHRASTLAARECAGGDPGSLCTVADAIVDAVAAGASPTDPIDYSTIARSAAKAEQLVQKITDRLGEKQAEAADGGTAQAGNTPRPFGGELHHLKELRHLLPAFAAKIGSDEYASANKKALIVRGDAGAGKTHLFCDVAERRRKEGLPTILLHGSDFEGGDPLPRIKTGLDLDTTVSEFLSALDAAGEASRSRALVLVDALNEGAGPYVWPKHLVEILDAVGRHPWVAIGLSVRTTYERLVISDGIVPAKAASITHAGFGDLTDKAMRVFFDANKIERPSLPLLTPEFSNPLFLTILCKGLRNMGMTRMPEDKFSLMSVYNMYIDSINEKLSGPGHLDRPREKLLVNKAVGAIAELMIDSGSLRVDYEAAYDRLTQIHPEAAESRSLLSLLIREGVLSVGYTHVGDSPRRAVEFGYERLAENLVIQSVLADSTADELPGLLASGGKLYKCLKAMQARRGLIEALSIQIPERFGRDLIEVAPSDASSALYAPFLASLAWRSPRSVGPHAVTLVDKCLVHYGEPHAAFRSLLASSAVPAHRLNAEHLDAALKPLTMAGRDATWSIFLDSDYCEDDSVVRRLIEWGRDADKSAARPEVIELAGIALAWFLTCHNRNVRDGATKALVSLLSGHTDVLIRILARFSECNDPYVTERLYCAAYGCALYARSDADLEKLAQHTYEAVFKGGDPPVDVLLRDYARLIIDEALHRGCKPCVDLGKCAPPYFSEWIAGFPSQEQIDSLKAKNSPTGPLRYGASALFLSLGTLGDFYTYILYKGMREPNWSDTPLLPGRLPRATALASLHQSITPKQKPHWEKLLRLLCLKAGRDGTAALTREEAPPPRAPGLGLDARPQAEKLAGLLDSGQRAMLDGALSWFDLPVKGDSPFDFRFDPRAVARWIAARVFELGWTSDLFGEHDGAIRRHPRLPHGAGRERVGKKYQWIAYHELLARLCDNYEFSGDPPMSGFATYHSSQQLQRGRDIDPSLLLSRPFPCTSPRGELDASFIAYRHVWDEHLDDAEWIASDANLPDIGKMASIAGDDGTEWLVLGTFFNPDRRIPSDQEDRATPYRSLDFYMDSFLVDSADAAALARWWSAPKSGTGTVHDNAPTRPAFIGELYSSERHRMPAGEPGSPWQEIFVGRRRRPVIACPNVHVVESIFGEYDYSTSVRFDYSIPSGPLADAMRLRHDGRGAFRDEDGALIAHDPSTTECGPTALLFRRDRMEDFLRAKSYGIVWRAVGNKCVLSDLTTPDYEWKGELDMYATCTLVNGAINCKVNTVINSGRGEKK